MLKKFLQLMVLVSFVVPALAQKQSLGDMAKATQEYAIQCRHEFHANPELRWKENETLARIKEKTRVIFTQASAVMPPSARFNNYKGGLAIDLTYDTTFDRILFRADIDALPLIEETGLEFASKVRMKDSQSKEVGVMHACGHDTHIAMALGFFKALAQYDIQPKHNIRLAFQRAEENPIDLSGGASLVQEGVLDGISAVYGLHIWANAAPGLFLSRPGPILANSDRIHMIVKCTGGHVALPQNGSNAIDIATDIHVALRGLDRRLLGAVEACSLVPAISNAGTASNIRPSEADLWYAARNLLNEQRRAEFADAVRARVQGVVAQYPDARLPTYEYVKGHPATVNTAENVASIAGLLQSAGQSVEMMPEPELGGDDFTYYLKQRPGAYFNLGANKPGAGGHHSPTFDIDETVLWRGVLFWLLLATN